MDIKELKEKFHEKDSDFSLYFHDIDKSTGAKKLSWGKIIITWIVAIIIVGAILGSLIAILSPNDDSIDSIYTDNTIYSNIENDEDFSKIVNVGGKSFNIPKGYSLSSSKNNNSIYSKLYSKGSSGISILVTPNPLFTLDEFQEYEEKKGFKTVNMTIGGYSGFEIIDKSSSIRTFYYEKDGSIISILLSSDFSFKSTIAKIIS